MNFTWIESAQKGQPETGKLIIYRSTDTSTKLILHYVAWNNLVQWISARFYTNTCPTDGFLHWIADDVRDLLTAEEKCIIPSEFIMHVEYYKLGDDLPFSLGDFALV